MDLSRKCTSNSLSTKNLPLVHTFWTAQIARVSYGEITCEHAQMFVHCTFPSTLRFRTLQNQNVPSTCVYVHAWVLHPPIAYMTIYFYCWVCNLDIFQTFSYVTLIKIEFVHHYRSFTTTSRFSPLKAIWLICPFVHID